MESALRNIHVIFQRLPFPEKITQVLLKSITGFFFTQATKNLHALFLKTIHYLLNEYCTYNRKYFLC